ncbi:MAG: DUF1573 domain-containing protein [Acidobacteria bacterium]|nr:DUF1573 domain-containing protein [Acidobacteriota bacterium]
MMQNLTPKIDLVRRPRRQILRAAILLVIGMIGFGTPPARGFQIAGLQGSSPGEQLREVVQTRVAEFYSLLQTRQISRAEQYATKDSRERLRDQTGNPFLGFRIVSVELEPGEQSATVVVELTVMVPSAGPPIPFQRTSRWKLEDNEWRIEIPEPPPSDSGGEFVGIGQQEAAKPKPEELKFEGHTYGLGVMKPGDVKEARFPFENVTDHVVKIKEVATGCECLKNKTEKMEYQPGEKGEMVIEFNSTGYEYAYVQTVVVSTSPGDVKSYLNIAAHVVPREIAFPQTQPEAKQQ